MFLNYIKNFFTKRNVKNTLSNVGNHATSDSIKTVGIVFDASYFHEKEGLILELIANGIVEKDIQILVYKDKFKKSEILDNHQFSIKDLNWNASFNKQELTDFTKIKFDLLINYYDIEKAPLLLVSQLSQAHFKVGFSSIDKRLNHFMINTNAENYQVFLEELFRYLKILNKI
jgi:hypothetical protein